MQRRQGKANFRRNRREGAGSDESNDKQNDRGSRPFRRDDKSVPPGEKSFRKEKGDGRRSTPFNRDKTPGANKHRNKQYDKRFDKDKKPGLGESPARKFGNKGDYIRKPYYKKNYDKPPIELKPTIESATGQIRLNRYLANAGVCSRREADDLIASGAVSVNGKVITEMGFKVNPGDIVNYGGETLKREKMVYILLNKPKDYITTVDDPQKRKTVLELIKGACRERVYPVGRLDRSTTGVLLFTNDGELTKRLTHPRYGIKKIYHVTLDKNLKQEDFLKIEAGIELEDGPIKVDEISYVGEQQYTRKEIGLQIHSGRNRIVRRIFESLGYGIVKLDRVYFGGLTKKDLPKGRWKFLSEAEINMLKMTAK